MSNFYRWTTAGLFALAVCLLAASSVQADEVQGRIKTLSKKAKTIQLSLTGKEKGTEVIRFDDKTAFENVEGYKKLKTKDLLRIEYSKGKPATKITKVVFNLPEGVEISVDEMENIIKGKEKYLLVDARPASRFPDGHLPTAIPIFGKKIEENKGLLPKDKSTLLIFYCGGETCPFTAIAAKKAMELGYTNVKGFQGGLPGWRKAKKPVHASAEWLTKNLNEHVVLIDARAPKKAAKLHIKGAATITKADLEKYAKVAKAEGEKKPYLLDVPYKGAPVVIYGKTDKDKEVVELQHTLMKWGYKRATILEGGLREWQDKNYPTEKNSLASNLRFVKKLIPGAVPPTDFARIRQLQRDVVFVDVRSEKEMKEGTLAQALQIPLDKLQDNLKKIPKDKDVIAYCTNGARAMIAYELLAKNGYNKARFLNETIDIEPDGKYTICCIKPENY